MWQAVFIVAVRDQGFDVPAIIFSGDQNEVENIAGAKIVQEWAFAALDVELVFIIEEIEIIVPRHIIAGELVTGSNGGPIAKNVGTAHLRFPGTAM